MPVELDIAGNFAKGQDVMLKRRAAKQLERARDQDLAAGADAQAARRTDMQAAGWDPSELDPLQTNPDPWFTRVQNWWKQRQANRVMPSKMMPGQKKTGHDELVQFNPGGVDPANEFYGGGGEAQTFALPDQGQVDVQPFRDGGAIPRRRVANEKQMNHMRRAIPKLADGGGVGARLEAEAARQARIEAERVAAKRAANPGLLARGAGALRAGANAVGRKVAPIALGATALDTANTSTEDYRKRFGMETNDPSLAGDIGVRALGAASDLGNNLTLGAAGKYYRDKQQSAIPSQEQAAQPAAPAGVPKTPDEAVAQEAIQQGTQMAAKAKEDNAPPGAIDFSQTDIRSDEIPNMPVKDWVAYRQQALKSLTARGMPIDKAMEESTQSVTKMQQQGFIDYSQQAVQHMQVGNMRAAAAAMRAAYQYFPNGSDVKFGVQRSKDGNPVLVGMGTNEETGEPVGTPMVLTPERVSHMMENMSNTGAFAAWTKDLRDFQQTLRKYEEVEKPKAQSEITYQGRAGRAALMTGQANLAYRTGKGGAAARTQTQLDHANDAFSRAVELLGYTDEAEADHLMSAMSQIYARSPWEYPQVIEFIRKAKREGRLDEVMQSLGLGE